MPALSIDIQSANSALKKQLRYRVDGAQVRNQDTFEKTDHPTECLFRKIPSCGMSATLGA